MVFTNKDKLLEKDQCIICFENCSHKFCKCNAVIHKSCLKEWNNSIYNTNKSKCPHCKRNINIKEHKNYPKIVYNDICNIFNSIHQYFITFILNLKELICSLFNSIHRNIIAFTSSLNELMNYSCMKLYYIILFWLCCVVIPELLGIGLFSISYVYNDIDNDYNEYIKKNLISVWPSGFLMMIVILHIWTRCKSGRCQFTFLGEESEMISENF